MKMLLAILLIVLVVAVTHAKPVAVGGGNGITVTLTDEPCAFTHVITLPFRITWEEKGTKFEGCYGIQMGIVVAYFSDKSVAIFPGHLFTPVTDL